MDHALFVARLVIREPGSGRGNRLAESSSIAMAEDAEDPGDQALALPIALRELPLEVQYERLRGGQPHGRRFVLHRVRARGSMRIGGNHRLSHRWRSVPGSPTLTTCP